MKFTPIEDFVIDGVLGDYKTTWDRHIFLNDLYYTINYLKTFSHKFFALLFNLKIESINGSDIRYDWFREALMSCVELGVGVTPQNAFKLLSDRAFFENLLPIPINSEEWGGASGTEIVRQWWMIASDEYRSCHLIAFNCFNELDPNQLKRDLTVHTNPYNRGFRPGDRLLSSDPCKNRR